MSTELRFTPAITVSILRFRSYLADVRGRIPIEIKDTRIIITLLHLVGHCKWRSPGGTRTYHNFTDFNAFVRHGLSETWTRFDSNLTTLILFMAGWQVLHVRVYMCSLDDPNPCLHAPGTPSIPKRVLDFQRYNHCACQLCSNLF